MRTGALYAAEYLTRNRTGLTKKLKTKERKIIRKMLGTVKGNNDYRRQHLQELYMRMENATNIILKERFLFIVTRHDRALLG